MGKRVVITKREKLIALHQIAAKEALLAAAAITAFTALGFLLAGSPHPLLVWLFEFALAFTLVYWRKVALMKKQVGDWIEE